MKDQTLCVHNIHPYVVDDEEEMVQVPIPVRNEDGPMKDPTKDRTNRILRTKGHTSHRNTMDCASGVRTNCAIPKMGRTTNSILPTKGCTMLCRL